MGHRQNDRRAISKREPEEGMALDKTKFPFSDCDGLYFTHQKPLYCSG